MKRCLLIVLAAGLVLSMAGCKPQKPSDGVSSAVSSQQQSPFQDLVVSVGRDPYTLDPVLSATKESATLLAHSFEGLVWLDETGTPVLAQAESYTKSADGKQYQFTLREGLKWNDGTDLTAYDFVYSWQRAIHPDTQSSWASLFQVIEGYDEALDLAARRENREPVIDVTKLSVKATDPRTLTITLKYPCDYFLGLCALPAFYPVNKSVVENNAQWAVTAAGNVGNGPYRLKRWEHNAYLLYEKNPYYRNSKAVGPDTIKFVLLEDETSALSAFQKGELSFIDQFPDEEIDAYEGKEGFHSQELLGSSYLVFNQKVEPFQSPLVRKALSLAIDRNALCNQMIQNGQVPAAAFVPESTQLVDFVTSASFRQTGGNYIDMDDMEGNLKTAKECLRQAGYRDGKNFPVFTLQVEDRVGDRVFCEAIRTMWKENLGIDCVVEVKKRGAELTGGVSFQTWYAAYPSPLAFLEVWEGSEIWGGEETYNTLIAEARQALNTLKGYEMLHQAEGMLFTDSSISPICYRRDYYLMDPKLTGVVSNSLGVKYFMYVS